MDARNLCFASGALLASLALVSGCLKPGARQSKTLFVWDRPVAFARLPIAKSTTCRIKKSLAAYYSKTITNEEPDPPERVYYEAGDEDEGDTVAFVDLDTKSPKVQSNGGQAPLSVLSDDGVTLQLINRRGLEPGPGGGTEIYTIFRDKGVVLHSLQKTAFLVGPFGTLEMGYCN